MKDIEETIIIQNVTSPPDFISVGRDWSFFGDVKYTAASRTQHQRLNQSMSDTDPVNRYLALASIVDDEKAFLIQAIVNGTEIPAVSDDYLQLYAKILTDTTLSPATRALFLNVHEAIPSRGDLGHHYQAIADAREIILTAVYTKHGQVIETMYNDLLELSKKKQNKPQIDGLMERPLLYVLYSVLAIGGKLDRLENDLQQLLTSTAMSDRYFALRSILELKTVAVEKKKQIQNDIKEEWSSHPIGCEQYIQCIANCDCNETTTYIRELVNEDFFNMNLAGHARTVARGWSANRKRCLMTDAGLELTKELFHQIGQINQMSAYSFLSSFGDLRKFEDSVQQKLVETLEEMKSNLDPDKQQSLTNQLIILLKRTA